MTLGWLITAHGFGHLMRCVPVLETLLRIGCRLRVGCAGRPLDELRRRFRDAPNLTPFEFDSEPGVIVKPGGLTIDWPATAAAVTDWVGRADARDVALGEMLDGVSLIVADGSPAAFTAARRLGIPSVLLASFTWLDQYRVARDEFPSSTWRALAEDYARVEEVWTLPLCQELLGVPVGRPRRPFGLSVRAVREEEVARLREEIGSPGIFVSLGQSVTASLELDRLQRQGWRAVCTPGTDLPGALTLDGDVANTHEVLAACDVALIKSGWTSVAEALACRKPMLLLGREPSPEDDFIIEALTRRGIGRRIRPESLPLLDGDEVGSFQVSATEAYRRFDLSSGVSEIAEACLAMAGART